MALKSKTEFKDVFVGVSSVLYQKNAPTVSGDVMSLDPEYDLPVTVDTLQISQDDPTINHYKVLGLDGDWTSTSTLGDATIQFTVPSKAVDVLKLAYGNDAVDASKTATSTDVSGTTFDVVSVVRKKKKVTGTFILVSEDGENRLVLEGAALWAKLILDNATQEPIAVQFSGTLEITDGASFHFLKKKK